MFHSRWLRDYALGVVLGFTAVALLFGLFLAMGWIDVQWKEITASLAKQMFFLHLVTSLFQTAFEELLFRGYLFQNLIKATNPLAATLILSGLFGLGHLLTPHASWVTALNLTALGVLFAVAYLKTRSLWLPSALHFAWNYFMRDIFSLPVSGTKTINSLLQVDYGGPAWLTGGDYGPEAGVPALAVMIGLTLLILLWGRIKISPEMKGLWEKDAHKPFD
jgi:membrane protease YdiL (CAAX protease family)